LGEVDDVHRLSSLRSLSRGIVAIAVGGSRPCTLLIEFAPDGRLRSKHRFAL
jgi:hypothetical protein